MEVRYTLTLDDYVAFNLHLARKSRVGRLAFVFLWLLLPVILTCNAILLLSDGVDDTALAAIAFLALVGCGYAIVFPRCYWWLMALITRTFAAGLGTHGVTGPITLILSETSFVEITVTTRSEVKWENMQGVVEVGNCTYIFITGVSAAVLPRHGFDADEEYEAVRDFALRKLADRVRN